MRLHRLVGAPGLLLHEACHAAVGAPFAETEIHVRTLLPHVVFRWAPSTSPWIVRVAHLAPTILGLVATLGAAVAAWPLVWAWWPANPFYATALALTVVYNWLLLVWPSYGDRHPFEGGGG